MKTIERFNDDVTLSIVDNRTHYEMNIVHNESGSARGIELSNDEMDLLIGLVIELIQQ